MVKRIGVLTSGGDAPGMNSAIRSIVEMASKLNIETIGIVNGYRGLYDNQYRSLTVENTAEITSLGGTILKSSRFEQFKQDDVVKQCVVNLRNNDIEALIVIGGDGTYRGALSLNRFKIPTIALPATIDNDIVGTELTIGFNTALSTIIENIEKLKDTARSHRRCLIVEVMGRHCPDLALYSGLAGNCDYVISNLQQVNVEKLSTIINKAMAIKDETIIVVSENIVDVYDLASQLEVITNIETRGIKLSYIQRGGNPSAVDRILASRFGIKSVELLSQHQYGLALNLIDGKIKVTSIEDALNINVKDCGIYEDFYKLR